MSLRSFQSELKQVAKGIAQGSGVKHIYCHVTQGGGKSAIAALLASELPDYSICWVTPRDSLRDQGASNFRDINEQMRYGNSGEIREAKNEPDPARNTRGYVTTYQSVVADPELHLSVISGGRYILILDECHHIPAPIVKKDNEDDLSDDAVEEALERDRERAYYSAVAPLVERAKIVVYASGSMERHENEKVAFVPYRISDEIYEVIDTSLRDGWAFIEYPRSMAIDDKAVLPIDIYTVDGSVTWIDGESNPHIEHSLADVQAEDISKIIYAANRSGIAYEIIDRAVHDWKETKANVYPAAKLLIIAATITLAEKYKQYLEEKGVRSMIAVSNRPDEARRAIRHFRGKTLPEVDVLVSVAMAYEGLDVRQISHVVCLTHIRSKPWIEQAVSRANRVDPEAIKQKTSGVIYALADRKMRELLYLIQYGQRKFIRDLDGEIEEKAEGKGGKQEQIEVGESRMGSIHVISLDGQEEKRLLAVRNKFGIDDSIEARITNMLLRIGNSESARKRFSRFLRGIENLRAEEGDDHAEKAVILESTHPAYDGIAETPSETERSKYLRSQIADIIKKRSGFSERKKILLSTQIKERWGVSRSHMTEGQLIEVLKWLRDGQPA